jgi:iron complex outermembrane receptor protein
MNRFFLFLVFSLTMLQLQAQVKSGSLKGIVHTAKGEALHNATISIQKNAVTMTDSTGKFVVSNIQTGRQEIVITAAGYSANTVIVHVQEGKEAEINITMEADGFMNEVVVTAGRKVESIKEVPSSVTFLQKKNI